MHEHDILLYVVWAFCRLCLGGRGRGKKDTYMGRGAGNRNLHFTCPLPTRLCLYISPCILTGSRRTTTYIGARRRTPLASSQRRWLIAEVPTNSLEHGGSQRDMPRDDSPPGSRSVGRSQRDLPPRHWYQPLGIQRAGVLRSVRREGQAERSRRHAVTGFYTEARVETTRNDRTGGGTILCTFASRMSSSF